MGDLKKILIAEDDPFLAKIMGNRLREEGFEVDSAENGEEALLKLEGDSYSVLMLDLIMPIKTGFEVLQGIREKKLPVIPLVFTNLAQEEDRTEVMNLGAKGYYVKSDIAMDELVKTVKSFVN
jgi:two-component system response regulator